ncbi:MAG TPA: flagellar export chaperone FlgN [Tepidisphaeraceae bacterium]|nr:flagellar export chaperone FlgN [Tepidisphaeraceae bacterium]
MSRLVIELENVLALLIEEHRRLLGHLQTQQEAMKKLQHGAMEESLHKQEASRLRIIGLENRRRFLVQQIAKASRLAADATLAEIAQASGPSGSKLLQLRDQLRAIMREIADRAVVAGRLAQAVLGHLNTAMRLFADAVGQAGTYTKYGVPRVSARIGVMEAVG